MVALITLVSAALEQGNNNKLDCTGLCQHLGPCCIDPVARNMRTGVDALKKPLDERCRLCRFMTVLYYLVDTEEGGEPGEKWENTPFT